MYIEAVPNRNSPPAILLRESYREGGKVRKRTLCNLSDWPAAHIEGLRGVLKGGTVIAAERDAFTVTRSLSHGHVAAALGTARGIGLDRVLGPDGNRCRDLALALLVGRILEPASKLAAARALSPATAASSLGEALGLGEVAEDELYRAGLAAGAPARHRDRSGQTPSDQRLSHCLKCLKSHTMTRSSLHGQGSKEATDLPFSSSAVTGNAPD